MPHVLFVDDNPDDTALGSLVLGQAFPDAVIEVVDGAIAFGEAFERGGIDLVITSYEQRWTDGLTVLRAVKERWPQVPVIMLARDDDERFAVEAMREGLDDFLVKSSKSFVALPEIVQQTLDRAEAKRSEARLETRLQTLLDQSEVGIFRATLDGRLLEVNPAFLRLLGKANLAEALSLDLRGLLIPAGDSGDPVRLFDDTGRLDRQVELQLPDGASRWVSVTEMILLDGEGDLVVDGLVQDVTELKQTESALESRAAELGQSNLGLQGFAALASHELREPLRMIEQYTQLLAEEYAPKLDLEASEYISYALDGAQRMQKLIADLMTLSQVEASSRSFVRVPCAAVVDRVLEDLDARVRAAEAVVTVDPLPTVLGDRSQLELLFKNLIDNAIKFHGNEGPRVRVSAVQQEERWLFSVSDNGVGFEGDPKQLFTVFRRLRPEIPGSGVGLSICQRVVEYHGGRIWAESEPGRGSTFRFSIPLDRGRRSERQSPSGVTLGSE